MQNQRFHAQDAGIQKGTFSETETDDYYENPILLKKYRI